MPEKSSYVMEKPESENSQNGFSEDLNAAVVAAITFQIASVFTLICKVLSTVNNFVTWVSKWINFYYFQVIFIADSHRPIDVCNIYNDGQIRLLMKPDDDEGVTLVAFLIT